MLHMLSRHPKLHKIHYINSMSYILLNFYCKIATNLELLTIKILTLQNIDGSYCLFRFTFENCSFLSADKSKKARTCCTCAASNGQTETTDPQCVPAGKLI